MKGAPNPTVFTSHEDGDASKELVSHSTLYLVTVSPPSSIGAEKSTRIDDPLATDSATCVSAHYKLPTRPRANANAPQLAVRAAPWA